MAATRQLLTDDRKVAQQFLRELEMEKLGELKNGYRIFCQLTNIQLRWPKIRQVDLDGLKYLEVPYDKDEENIVKGKN